jgi:hypothetical protein
LEESSPVNGDAPAILSVLEIVKVVAMRATQLITRARHQSRGIGGLGKGYAQIETVAAPLQQKVQSWREREQSLKLADKQSGLFSRPVRAKIY